MTKKLLLVAIVIIANLSLVNAQADFEDLNLPVDSFWNGADLSGGFTTGNTYFKNYYDTSYYSWAGFCYSSKTDTTTAGWSNQYSTIAGSGYNNSQTFGLYSASYSGNPVYIKFNNNEQLTGFYVTNNTYAYISMRDGDSYSKKFGGTTGDDPDWFKLKIFGYKNGNFIDTVVFYLADFRFNNNADDYIIKDWTFVDLSSISNADSLTFDMSSTDNGQYGMNTPAYFCIDNLDYTTSITANTNNNKISIYPNPAKDKFTITNLNNAKINIYNITGKIILSQESLSENSNVDISHLKSGIYFVKIKNNNSIITKKLVVE